MLIKILYIFIFYLTVFYILLDFAGKCFGSFNCKKQSISQVYKLGVNQVLQQIGSESSAKIRVRKSKNVLEHITYATCMFQSQIIKLTMD